MYATPNHWPAVRPPADSIAISQIISLGSNIGSGLFIGTGAALAAAGPGNMVIAYLLVCSCVWAVLQTLSEMTIAFPTSGNYIDYADRWVDPALAFGAGLAEWLGKMLSPDVFAVETDLAHQVGPPLLPLRLLSSTFSSNSGPMKAFQRLPLVSGSDLTVSFLASRSACLVRRTFSLLTTLTVTIFVVITCAIFVMPNTVFAWFEYGTSLIKIGLFILIILLSLAIVCGAGPEGYVHDGASWTDLPAFKNGFSVRTLPFSKSAG